MTIRRLRWLLALLALALGGAAAFVRSPVNPSVAAAKPVPILRPASGC